MIKLNILPNADLEIELLDREEFEELFNKGFQDERHYLSEMLESGRYIGNDWHVPYDLGLTEVPAIGNGACYNEDEGDDTIADYDFLWGYPNYMLSSFLDELKENGKVVFTKI